MLIFSWCRHNVKRYMYCHIIIFHLYEKKSKMENWCNVCFQESASLADRLIQYQLTRAQEAEETYALKNDLSTTKQKLADSNKKLKVANSLIGDIKQRVILKWSSLKSYWTLWEYSGISLKKWNAIFHSSNNDGNISIQINTGYDLIWPIRLLVVIKAV